MTESSTASSQAAAKSERNLSQRTEVPWYERYINIIGPLIMIIMLAVLMLVLERRFFELPNLMIIMQDAAIFMVLGMAMTLVITGGGIDLSVGAVATLAALIMALLIKDYSWNTYLAMLMAVAIGVLCGSINGLVITRLNVPDLLATLALDQIYRGIGLVLAAGVVLARFPDPIPFLGRGRIGGVFPTAAIVGIVFLIIGVILYRYTWFGRYAIAIGGNREAAILTGININRHKLFHYMLMGGCAAVAGILLTGRLNAIQATAGAGFALHAIAAVVVGGTALFGGRGTMFGTLVGVLLLSMVTNALVMLRLQFFWQLVASGLIIICSIGFYSYLQRREYGDSQ